VVVGGMMSTGAVDFLTQVVGRLRFTPWAVELCETKASSNERQRALDPPTKMLGRFTTLKG
jgi:hypothetical protein